MTISEYKMKIERAIQDKSLYENPLLLAASSAMAIMGQRIFSDGKNTEGGDIGKYSTKPLYVSLSTKPKPTGAPTGKTGDSIFKSGNKHLSKYFPDGYRGYRANVGRESEKVNLSMTNEMRLDFSNQNLVAPKPIKTGELEYSILLKKKINQKKRSGNEERFGTIFDLSENEIAVFNKSAKVEFQRALKKLLK